MHSYQIDEILKTRRIFIVATISILAAYFLSLFLVRFPKLSVWYIDYPSVLGFYAIFMWVFNNYLWKLKLIKDLHWLSVPDLGGVWDVEIKSSSNSFESSLLCKMYIRQTGSTISISMDTETSVSYSIHAAILCSERLSDYEIMFNYINKPKGDSEAVLNIHYGTAWLQISENSCDGDYFTGRGRQTYGRIKIIKKLRS